MENSSKALIIAAAVVLSILIIGLGMYFYNQANASSKGIKMTEYEINNVNSKFAVYEGKINANKASELLETVIAYNASVGSNGYGVIIGYVNQEHSAKDSTVYMDENDIARDFYTKDVSLKTLFINGDSGIAVGTTPNFKREDGALINSFMFGMTTRGSAYYQTLKSVFSDKTHDYVGVSYYEKKTGLLRGIMVYNCEKEGAVLTAN